MLARQMTPDELMNGGQVNGVMVDPVTLLFHGLQQRFAPLGEETRLASLTAIMTFGRRGNERINELLTRFETTLHANLRSVDLEAFYDPKRVRAVVDASDGFHGS